MMSGHVNLKSISYENIKQKAPSMKDLSSLVDDIVYEMVTNNAKLINDIEKGSIPFGVLEQQISNYIDTNKIALEDEDSREQLMKKVKDYLWGYGPMQELIEDMDISDIKIVDKNNTRVKKKGRRLGANISFPSEKSLLTFCYYICIKNGGSLSELNAIQKLTDTKSLRNYILRLNVCINPVNSRSPSVAIRKIPKNKLTLYDLVKESMLNTEIYKYLIKAIKSKLNIVVCGKGASGKTTLLNAFIDHIPHDHSVLLMQESEELHTAHPDCISQVVKQKSGESDIEYTLRDLTINGLLMDIDRMIIGEIKGAEAMELFNAIYTGHEGSMTSVHSGSAKEALRKIIHLMKYSNTDLSHDVLMEMLTEIDLIIFMKSFKCAEVIEIAGYDSEKKEVLYNPVFQYAIEKEYNGRIEGEFKRLNNSCEKVQNKFNINDYDYEVEKL